VSERPPEGPPLEDRDPPATEENDPSSVPSSADEGPPSPATWAGRQAVESEDEGETKRANESNSAEGDEDASPDVGDDARGDEQGPSGDDADAEPREAGTDAGQATQETDTVSAADREAAQEAALAGVRARAAAAAAKSRELPARTAPPTPGAPGSKGPPTDGGAPLKATPAATPKPRTPTDAGEPPKRGLWLRFVAASFLIVASMATATAVSLLVYLTGIAKGLGGLDNVQSQLEPADPGKPETFLILGSDRRPGEVDKGRSDTTILVRLDPDQNAIRVLSIPRDLKVNIPGHGIDKFNAAYTYGGPKSTLTVVKQLTGLDVNHVVNIDFTGFADAVNAVGCVYVDVDRHYYVPPEADYAEINIDAGYQRLCGLKALQYVRFRHDDNDLVRAARQQTFLREARQEVTTGKLIGERDQLLDIFTTYTTSDINSATTVLDLLRTFISARDAQVQQLHFPAELGGAEAAYVTASESAVKDVVQQFLGETADSSSNAGSSPQQGGSGRGGGSGGSENGGSAGDAEAPPAPSGGEPAPTPTIDVTSSGQQYAAAVNDKSLHFPIFIPTRLVPDSTFSDASRSFIIDGPGDQVYWGYKLVVSRFNGAYYEYYGVSGTDWRDPPILSDPTEERTINGRNYLLFYDGGKLRQVGWKTEDASYWVENTLLETLTPSQMLAIAESVQQYTG